MQRSDQIKRQQLFFCLALLLLGIAVYANGMGVPFLYDGIIHIQHNPAIRDITQLSRVLHSGYQETRPLFMLSLALCYHMAGLDVFVYHLFNLLLHLASVILIYQITFAIREEMTADKESGAALTSLPYFPAIAALLFLLHPFHTESVTYINARSGLMMTCLGLMSWWLWMLSQRIDSPVRRRLAYVGSLAALLLAITSKEPAILFPLAMLLYSLLFSADKANKRKRCLSLIPHFLCIALLPVLYLIATNPHPNNPFADAPFLHHAWTHIRVTGMFLVLLIAPYQQNFDYETTLQTSFFQPSVIGTILVLIALGIWAWRQRNKAPIIGFALCWYLLFLAPTNSIVLRDFIAERYLYASILGIAWLLAWAFSKAMARWQTTPVRPLLVGLLVAYLGWLGTTTIMRNHTMQDQIALWRHTTQQSPRKGRPHLNLAVLLLQAGKQREGHKHLKLAVKYAPTSSEVHRNMGVFAERQRRFEAAAAHYERAYKYKPIKRYLHTIARMHRKAGVHWYAQKRYKRAKASFLRAIQRHPTHPIAHFNLALVLRQQGKYKAAEKRLNHLLSIAPMYIRGQMLLAQVTRERKAKAQPQVTPQAAAKLLFVPLKPPKPAPVSPMQALAKCHRNKTPKAQVQCMLRLRYKDDAKAMNLALTLYQKAGWVAGLQPAQKMKGGWRGKLTLVPQLPMGRYRKHLKWLLKSVDDYKRFIGWLKRHAKRPMHFRWQALGVQFFRSVGRATPSAMALHWDLYYNVNGSLLRSAKGTRETFFHEIFHLNDAALGQWTEKALKPLYEKILKRCTKGKKVNNRCLKPYAPHPTIIRRLGIYYAFHKEGGVMEYGAELAIRYYREHRAIFLKQRAYKPFKCRTQDNALAWKRMADAFFGGVDLTPACSR